jgi:Uma2 family endonuclease
VDTRVLLSRGWDVATAIVDRGNERLTLELPSGRTGLTVSPEAFWDICAANPDLRLTRTADGELIAMAPAGSETGFHNAGLTARLWNWNDANGLGVVFDSSAGFTLPNGFVHAPDAAWIARDRWDALAPEERKKFAPICPDFVAELMSPSDTRHDTRDKLLEFLNQGVRLGWLLDPKAVEVEVYRPGQPVEVLKRPATLSGEDVLPGFVLDLKRILFD